LISSKIDVKFKHEIRRLCSSLGLFGRGLGGKFEGRNDNSLTMSYINQNPLKETRHYSKGHHGGYSKGYSKGHGYSKGYSSKGGYNKGYSKGRIKKGIVLLLRKYRTHDFFENSVSKSCATKFL